MHYEILGDPFFREHDVPRTLELSTAREAGDTSVPAELVNYPARSAAGKRQRVAAADLAGLMTAYRAAWVCPIDQPPIRDGVVDGRRRQIAAVRDPGSGIGDQAIARPRATWRSCRGSSTRTFISSCRGCAAACRRRTSSPIGSRRWSRFAAASSVDDPEQSWRRFARRLASCASRGTVAVGDISNSLASVAPMSEAGLDGVVFHELLGFKERDGGLIESTRERPRCRGRRRASGSRLRRMRRTRRRPSCSRRFARP